MSKNILILDNLDSFTYNVAHLFAKVCDYHIEIKRAYELTSANIDKYDYLVLSPGPMKPKDHPLNFYLIKKYYKTKPILGICLGMQCINEEFGGQTLHSPYPVHGKVSLITHSNKNLFIGLPEKFNVARYHSLMCKVDENYFDIDATSIQDDVIMAIKLKNFPVFGIQYHPESFLTEYGEEIIKNFLTYD
jgi:anthranilate synthase component 2